jgi:uncharacterized protein with FMN-binding domain
VGLYALVVWTLKMKKILLSLAVIAASGGYVVAENQTGKQLAVGNATASANPLDPQPKPKTEPAVMSSVEPEGVVPAPAPITTASLDPIAPAPTRPVKKIPEPIRGDNEDHSVQVAAIDPVTAAPPRATAVAVAPVPFPPLPRPRPADIPVASIQKAAAPAPSQYSDGTFKGTSENAYYGRVQVAATIQNGQIVSINVLQYPNDRRTSRYINGQALPILTQEVVQAQSANVDMVSGATLTSNAYLRSLQSALNGAHGGNA